MADPVARLDAFARGLALASNLSARDTERLYARVDRLKTSFHRGGEWRAMAHLTGSLVHPYTFASASTTDLGAGVYAHGPTADAAVDAAIAEWRRAIRERAAKAERDRENAARDAERWRAIVAAMGADHG